MFGKEAKMREKQGETTYRNGNGSVRGGNYKNGGRKVGEDVGIIVSIAIYFLPQNPTKEI